MDYFAVMKSEQPVLYLLVRGINAGIRAGATSKESKVTISKDLYMAMSSHSSDFIFSIIYI